MRLRGPIDLAASLQGGQAFRWRVVEGAAYEGALGESVVRLAPRADGGVDARASAALPCRVLERYFRLEPEDARRRERLASDPALAPAVVAQPGLRLLRQDPWETTVAFVTSANNNVLRIERILHALASRWGMALEDDHQAFPAPERLARAREASLRAAGLGYRAPFVRATARAVARGDVDLDALRGAPLADVRAALLALPGVGPKVADCIALFSLDADGAFPIDRWVLRAVSQTFFDGAPVKPHEVERFARERWGDDAGLAQQFLFHAARLRDEAPGTRRLARSVPSP